MLRGENVVALSQGLGVARAVPARSRGPGQEVVRLEPADRAAARIAELVRLVGQQAVELDFLTSLPRCEARDPGQRRARRAHLRRHRRDPRRRPTQRRASVRARRSLAGGILSTARTRQPGRSRRRVARPYAAHCVGAPALRLPPGDGGGRSFENAMSPEQRRGP